MNRFRIPVKPGYWIMIELLFLLSGCATISQFDQYSYAQATSIKIDALNIMDSAINDYQLHKPEVIRVKTSIDKIYEYEKHRPKNTFTDKMWGEVKDSSGHLFGGFIARWQREGKLNKIFIQEAKTLVSDSFDEIAQLESKKIKPGQVSN